MQSQNDAKTNSSLKYLKIFLQHVQLGGTRAQAISNKIILILQHLLHSVL